MFDNALQFLGIFFVSIAVIKFAVAMYLRRKNQTRGDTEC